MLCLVKYIVSYASINRLNAPLVVNAQGALPIDLIYISRVRLDTAEAPLSANEPLPCVVSALPGEVLKMQRLGRRSYGTLVKIWPRDAPAAASSDGRVCTSLAS